MNNEAVYNLLKSYDEKLLNPEIRKSPQEISQLLADEFIEIGASGTVYDKQKTIETLVHEKGRHLLMEDYKTKELSAELILSTYLLVKSDKDDIDKEHSFRTSIWKISNGNWHLIFHQGTLIK